MAAGRLKQLKLLLWKNWLFSVRSWKSTLLQLFAPCFFIVLATALSYLPQGLEDDPAPKATPIGTLPHCYAMNIVKEVGNVGGAWNGMQCTSLVVIIPQLKLPEGISLPIDIPIEELPHPDITCVNNLVNKFKQASNFSDSDVVTYEVDFFNFQDIYLNITDQFSSNKTQVGVVFTQCNESIPALSYTILFNSSRSLKFEQLIFGSPNKPDGRVELALGLDQIFMSQVLGRDVNIHINASSFPVFYQQQSIQSKQTASATLFIFCAITVQFVMLLYNVVSEKDLKLRQGLKLIGLKDSVYWMSWSVTAIIIAFLSTCILMATGYACQLQFFFNTNFLINFILFLLYSISMFPLAFFTTVFITTVRAAVNTGMVVFVVGMMIINLLGNQFLLAQLYEYVLPLVGVLALLPPFHLAKAMADIGAASSATDMNGLPQPVEYFDFHSLFKQRKVLLFDIKDDTFSSRYFEMPSTYISLLGLLGTAVLYGILSWYFDAILRGNHGIPRNKLFFIYPSYWFDWLPYYHRQGLNNSINMRTIDFVQRSNGERSKSSLPGMGAGVAGDDGSDEEDPTTKLLGTSSDYGSGSRAALRIDQLVKTFAPLCSCEHVRVKPAVDGLSLRVEEHQILVLLGHNGAGKTTTINMLIGLLEPDEGDAYFYDVSVRRDIDLIRMALGVCPQHDVLWGDLTALEHMKLFGSLKGLKEEEMKEEIARLLKHVQLERVAKNPVNTYSGGMKRRLSVALSLLGNPKILFLDEPTTGMDPKIRRDIWNLILSMKQNRVIIMTTHSMEEADILGDNIAIMAKGQLKVMGTSVNLKNRFAGYKVEVVVKSEHVLNMMGIIEKKLPGATRRADPIDVEGGGVLLAYSLAPERHNEVVPFFTVIEKDHEVASTVLDYSISQTTLEEVFLNVTVNELFEDASYRPLLVTSASFSPTMEKPTIFPASNSVET